MKEDYLVKIVTRQEIEGEKEILEVITHCNFRGTADDYTLEYTEQEDDGTESRTKLRVEKGNLVTVNREGSVNTYMVIENDTRNLSHHVTPYGSFSMGVTAMDIQSDISEKGGRLVFKYATDIEMSPLGIIEFDITLKPKRSLMKNQED